MGNEQLNILVVDDEPLTREMIRTLLEKDPDVASIAEASTGGEAVQAIHEQPFDLVFLDVQMPEMDGFAALERIDPLRLPVVIFVTAYDRYAVRAFEINALDYLLKPFDEERFEAALHRAKAQMQKGRMGDFSARLLDLVHALQVTPKGSERVVVKTRGRTFFLKTQDIEWVEAEGNYVRLHAGGKSYLFEKTLTSLEARLAPSRFIRIHRSSIVNIDYVRELQPRIQGKSYLILHNGTRLPVSRRHRERLYQVFNDLD